VDRFSRVLKILKAKILDFHNLEILEGQSNFIKDLQNAQKGEFTHYNAQERIVHICQRLIKGEEISIDHETMMYGVHKETIKKDIYTLRDILRDYKVEFNDTYKIKESERLTVAEALMILLMTYHSKSLNATEVKTLQTKIVKQFSGEEQKRLRSFFSSFDFYYQDFVSKELIQDIEKIFRAITQKRLLTFTYAKPDGSAKVRLIKPFTIIVHDSMYYLVGEELESDKPNPVNFRLDRIHNLTSLHERYKENEHTRFQPGEYINESYNMFTGKKEIVTLKIRPYLREYLIRKFPFAKSIKVNEDWETLEVIVRGTDGILFWILSQKADVEVVGPRDFREKVITTIQSMIQVYK
jgi:predicted DNA-binding transcriptional regulator YafY